ncbi:hypothetical protein [Luteimonas saliphila]|uniref:hypothetical protein n=1 Tax=Luteimonas saliphila TaxID=2804919 RepID=UPI00192D9BB3|nr:hypothetical protein [Luteimonas saliphila]
MNSKPAQSIPHPYRATGDVSGTRATERAIQLVIAQWIVAGIDRDTDAEVMAVAGGGK